MGHLITGTLIDQTYEVIWTMKLSIVFLFTTLSLTQVSFSKPNSKADHVKVTLYYAALCGGCHGWILDEMYPTYQKLGKYMEVGFVPYGNAHQHQDGDSWSFQCQHGPCECKGNMQQSCMFNYVTDQDTYVDIIYCIENSGDITDDDNVKKCLTDSFVPVETIKNIVTCWDGDEGIQLHHENGVKTEELVPPHEYVPWVTFNDEHSEDDTSMYCQDDLCRCLCEDYLMDVPECQGDILDFCVFS